MDFVLTYLVEHCFLIFVLTFEIRGSKGATGRYRCTQGYCTTSLYEISSFNSYLLLFQGSLEKTKHTDAHLRIWRAARRREPNSTKSASVGSEMQRDIIVRQTNVDVRATSAERAVYFWQWAGNLAGSPRIRVQVGSVGARSQRGIAVTISDHANSGLVPFSDSCTLHGVPQHAGISHGDAASRKRHRAREPFVV